MIFSIHHFVKMLSGRLRMVDLQKNVDFGDCGRWVLVMLSLLTSVRYHNDEETRARELLAEM